MNEFYVWLYERCAAPWLCEDSFPASYRLQKQEWQQVLQGLSRRDRLLCVDLLDSTRLLWGASAFLRGLHLGVLLGRDMPGEHHWEETPTSPADR